MWTVGAHGQGEVIRVPLQKAPIKIVTPSEHAMRTRVDPQTNNTITFDPMPLVTVRDARLGLYDLTWIGYDGRPKRVSYQRPDRIDAVVEASAQRLSANRYRYSYLVTSLKTSAEDLAGFAVQTFAGDVVLTGREGVYGAKMLSNGLFASGSWFRFAPVGPTAAVRPGGSGRFVLESSAPPGLVECRVHGGEMGLRGADEEPPAELERTLPGYEAWPHGHTIGPMAELGSMSESARAARLISWLQTFRDVGWMSIATMDSYKRAIERGGISGVASTLESDLAAHRITAEVVAVVRGMQK
jgi:hypothetical protein